MLDWLLSFIAPHHCYACGEKRAILCECCKNNILDEAFLRCVVCMIPCPDGDVCMSHETPYTQAWCVARREGPLARVIDDYKFKNVRAAYRDLARLLAGVLPEVDRAILVPIPTTPRNIRVRGHDHMQLITRELARLRTWRMQPLLRRQNNVTQHFAKTAAQRRRQAASFFQFQGNIDPDATYILVDDIYTTGSTVEAAALCLRAAGATSVYVAVIVRQ